MCFCIFWHGISSGFSGQNIIAEWAYQLYNIGQCSESRARENVRDE